MVASQYIRFIHGKTDSWIRTTCGFFTDFQVKTPSGWWKAGWTCKRTWVDPWRGGVHCVVVLAPGSLEAAVVSSRKPTLSDLWHEGDGLLIDTAVMIFSCLWHQDSHDFLWIFIDFLACAAVWHARQCMPEI